MKKSQSIVKKHHRSCRNAAVKPSTVAEYLVYFGLFLLLQHTFVAGWTPLAFGLFAGLTYAKRNLIVIAFEYIVAGLIFSFSVWTLLYSAAPALVFGVIYLAFFKLKRNVDMAPFMIATLVAELPYAVCTAVFTGDFVAVSVCVVVAAVFSVVCTITCYALLIRGINSRFTLDETICFALSFGALAFALYSNSLGVVNLYYAVFTFAIMVSACTFSSATTLIGAIVAGIGAALGGGGVGVLAAAAVSGAVAVAAKPLTRFAPAFALIAVQALVSWAVFGLPYDWVQVVEVAIGATAYAVLPKRVRDGIRSNVGGNGVASIRSLVNRDRAAIAQKLNDVSEVFFTLSNTLSDLDVKKEFGSGKLAMDVARNFCGKCRDREGCFSALGKDTSNVLEPMSAAALSRGKITILDMPPFITSRCKKMPNLISAINAAAEGYRRRRDEADKIESGRNVMAEQFAGMALVMDSLANECGENVTFDSDKEDELSTQLLKHNIVANEVVVTGRDGEETVTLCVRDKDADKAVLPRVVGAVLHRKMEVGAVTKRGNERIVHLESAPVYEVAYGVAQHKRRGQEVSGDSKSVLCPSRQRRLFAISDGMGSGIEANEVGERALKMIENFYRAGFKDEVVLAFVNKLLGVSDEEHFSALDIAVADTACGNLDLIKLGAAAGFLIHPDSVEVIASSAPPVGILDKVEPSIDRKKLKDGDIYLMMSDGVFDVLDVAGVMKTVDETQTGNPQVLADAVMRRAVLSGATDDCTVVALRLIAA